MHGRNTQDRPIRSRGGGMASGAVALASSAMLTACSVFGVRTVEEPPYRSLARVGAVEIRGYGPRLAAETVVGGAPLAPPRHRFCRRGAVILGAHPHPPRARVARTFQNIPASQASATIPMTAPVAQAPDPSGAWRIRFFMPAGSTSASLPEPLNHDVRIVTVPGETVAVLRYSGVATKGAVQEANRRLLRTLSGSAWQAEGTPVAWFYDPPWTLPPLRRNEAAVMVSQRAGGG